MARAVSIAAFVTLTTPVAAHIVARAANLTDVPLWAGSVIDQRREDRRREELLAEGAGGAVPGEPPLGGV
jgi:multicomponent Na+:H+ antiporter subunit G